MSALPHPDPDAIAFLHARFLIILPRIELHGHVYFRHVKNPTKKEDFIAEMVDLCWKWFVRLVQRGKDPLQFPSTLASFAAKHVRSGRKLCGKDKAQDVMSGIAQQRHGFTVSPLPDGSSLNGNVFDEALQDNTRSEVPEQVCFRIDFPRWRLTHTERKRRILDDLMIGERTLNVSRKFGVSPGRISQMRVEFHDDWSRFTADPGDTDPPILD